MVVEVYLPLYVGTYKALLTSLQIIEDDGFSKALTKIIIKIAEGRRALKTFRRLWTQVVGSFA